MKALKLVRVLVAAAMFTLVTLFFLGLGGGFGLLEKIQLGPALLGCAVVPLAAWLVVTLLFGRVYCSMVCPLGILQDILARVVRPFGRKTYAPQPGRAWLRGGTVLGFALLVVIGGAALAGLVEPYSVFGRIASELLQPVAEWGNNLLADGLGTEGSIVLFKREVLVRSAEGLTVAVCALVLLAILVAWKGRLVCNTVCPMGAILAALSGKTAFRLAIDGEKCVKCGLCSGVCKALCLDGKNQKIDNARCVRCFNCVGKCPKGAISFTAVRGRQGDDGTDDSRREFMVSAGIAGVAAVGIVGSSRMVLDKRAWPKDTLPPPGADPDRFRCLCTGCGLCVAKCPRKVLTPAGFKEYGPLGFMMPKLDFAHGHCDPACTVCGEVCPTGALRPFTVEQKRTLKMGVAVFDHKKCLACTEKIPCGLCERRCPQQAISLKEKEVKDGDRAKKIQVPVIDTAKCTGCGKCENYCPAGAMRVKWRIENGKCKMEMGDVKLKMENGENGKCKMETGDGKLKMENGK